MVRTGLCKLEEDDIKLQALRLKLQTGEDSLLIDEVKQFYDEISLCLEKEDLGKAFYQKLTDKSGTRLIDFEDFNNNTFNSLPMPIEGVFYATASYENPSFNYFREEEQFDLSALLTTLDNATEQRYERQ